jgi:hypothetical protein
MATNIEPTKTDEMKQERTPLGENDKRQRIAELFREKTRIQSWIGYDRKTNTYSEDTMKYIKIDGKTESLNEREQLIRRHTFNAVLKYIEDRINLLSGKQRPRRVENKDCKQNHAALSSEYCPDCGSRTKQV